MIDKYTTIVKVEQEKFLKYHTDDLLSFVRYLDRSWPTWRYFNVFQNGKQVGNFTKNNRPAKKQL